MSNNLNPNEYIYSHDYTLGPKPITKSSLIATMVASTTLHDMEELKNRCDMLEKKYDDLAKKFEQLELHIKYAPDGEGAGEAKKHFEELSDEQCIR